MISDWGAIKELIPHGVAKDEKQAAELAIKAGVDIEMMTTCYPDYLKELLEEGRIAETLIDEAVMRILKLKNELGLFENPYRGADEQAEAEVILSKEHREIAKKIAQKSMVLLKMKIFCLLHRKKNRACRPRGPITRYFRGLVMARKERRSHFLMVGPKINHKSSSCPRTL